jgi:hypothetical protein
MGRSLRSLAGSFAAKAAHFAGRFAWRGASGLAPSLGGEESETLAALAGMW